MSSVMYQRYVVRKNIFNDIALSPPPPTSLLSSLPSFVIPLHRELRDDDRVVSFNIVALDEKARFENRHEWHHHAYVDALFVLNDHVGVEKILKRVKQSLDRRFSFYDDADCACANLKADDGALTRQRMIVRDFSNMQFTSHEYPILFRDKHTFCVQLMIIEGNKFGKTSREYWPSVAEMDAVFTIEPGQYSTSYIKQLCETLRDSFHLLFSGNIDIASANVITGSIVAAESDTVTDVPQQ